MRIVQIMPEFGLAGAEIMCENLIYELIKNGYDVTVISMYDYHSVITERLENVGVEIRYLGKRPGFDISIFYKIKKILSEVRADVIHTHRNCAQYAVPAAILAGVKHRVHTVHNVAEKENGKLARKLNDFFFKHCHLIPVALSELIRDSIVREYGLKKDEVPVIYNGIDLSRCLLKTDYSIYGNFKIIHVGRFSEQKNHIGLLKAFKLFHDDHPDSELWLIGDGEKKIEIEEYVAENNLIESVKFLGLQSNVYGYLHDADMFTLPSNYEGVPISLIEAMGTGLPIVATTVGGVPDMLDNNNAVLTDLNVSNIAAAFEKYYLSAELRCWHGQNAYKRSAFFSAETMCKSYMSVYR